MSPRERCAMLGTDDVDHEGGGARCTRAHAEMEAGSASGKIVGLTESSKLPTDE
jgi:hypothetical protein